MASPTKQVETRRAINKARRGRLRKNKLRIEGSTQANLPLNKPNAGEIAAKKKTAK